MRATLWAIVAASVVAGPFVQAGHGHVSHSGLILVSDTGLATTALAPCQPGSALDGLDAHWYDVRDYAGHAYAVRPDALLDAFIMFWSEECAYAGGGNSAGPGWVEDGTVPLPAAYAVVSGYVGSPTGVGAYTFTLG